MGAVWPPIFPGHARAIQILHGIIMSDGNYMFSACMMRLESEPQ